MTESVLPCPAMSGCVQHKTCVHRFDMCTLAHLRHLAVCKNVNIVLGIQIKLCTFLLSLEALY